MDLGFRGEMVDFYHRYRRGYPPAAIDALVRAFELTGDDIVVDLGCGTGQLTLPVARRVRAVVGVDPEPDMLLRARRAAAQRGVASAPCGTDEESQQRYRDSLAGAGFDVTGAGIDYTDELSLDQIVGGLYSALPASRLPAPEQRPDLAEQIRQAVQQHAPFTEHVHVAILAGRIR